MTAIRLRGITRSFGQTQVLKGIDLDVAAGSVTAILGASGCGKTTLLRLLAGFDAPSAGTIVLGDQPVFGPGCWVPPQRRRVGYVAQEGALFPHLTVAENIGFGLAERGPAAIRAIDELLLLVGLDATFTKRYPHELSGGQQQRVALARALAPRPEVVLLDEPFSSLDAGLREGTRRAIMTALASTRTTAVLVTHDQAEALSVADQVGVMFAGLLAQVGPPRELYAAPASLEVGMFLGEANVLDADLRGDHAVCALGTVPICPRGALGHGTVLVRPEQVELVSAETPGCVVGQVRQWTFYGPIAAIQVALRETDLTVTARIPSYQALPTTNSAVGVLVRGTAAAFPNQVATGQPVGVTPAAARAGAP
jgi:iron(III) transport system ATP-binding protein